MILQVRLLYEPRHVDRRGNLIGTCIPGQWVAIVLDEGPAFGMRGRGRVKAQAVHELRKTLQGKGLHGSMRIR